MLLVTGALLLVGAVALVLLLDRFNGRTHVITTGKSYGFEIGMTKAEVFSKYKELNEIADICAYGTNGKVAWEDKPADLKYTVEFEQSDHWMAYRRKRPLDSQEFYFRDGKLTKIVNIIRFFETP